MADSKQPRSKSVKKSAQRKAGSKQNKSSTPGNESAARDTASKKSAAAKRPKKKAKPKPDTSASAKQPRACQYLFVLGSGVDPGDQAEQLRQEFQKIPNLEFSNSEQFVVGIGKWKQGDKESLQKSVLGFLEAWFAAREEPLDEKRLLIRNYEDDSTRFAVAGYFPRAGATTAASGQPPTDANETADNKNENAGDEGDSDDLMFAEATEEKSPNFLQNAITGLKNQPPKRLAIIGSAVAILAICAFVLPGMLSDSGNQDGVADGTGAGSADQADGQNGNVAALPVPQFPKGLVRVYTKDPGFRVLIDGQPVRDQEGEFVTTPCAITTKRGTRTITVYQEGYVDESRQINVEDDSETELEPAKDKAGIGSFVLAAPHLMAEVGMPIPLAKLNSPRAEFDPYVTPDQLSIWFVGDRLEGRGIYVASRLSPLHDFDEPRLISRSTDLPGSPSVTDDALNVVYVVPEKARLFALTRSNPLANFSDKQPIRNSKSLAPTWTSAQMLGDGTRVYWVEINSKETRTLVASRSDTHRNFGNLLKVPMPGMHPCLTTDGLRQFTYDGKKITRYRRLSPKKRFTSNETIAELELANYTPSKRHRQFFVTADEQWMFYCDDPENGGDLFMVRIAEQAGWGVVPKGKTISPKPIVVAQVPDPVKPKEAPKPKPKKDVDPRSLPLPYTSHWGIFSSLISSRQYSQLEGLIRITKSNAKMKPFAEQLKWDEEELVDIQQFWKDIDAAVGELKKGDQIRIGKFQVDFQEYKNGELYTRRGVNPIRRKLSDLTPSELLGIYDRKIKADDLEAQYRAAIFLAYDNTALARSVQNRMDKAGDIAEKFNERQVRRALVQAIAELDRANFGKGVAFLNDVKARAKGTPIEQEVIALEEKLYTYIKWAPRGPRKWQQTEVSHTAALGNSRGSLLLSEMEYKNFEMSLEWKVDDATTAQGGVYFRYPGQGSLTEMALKIHLANDAGINPDPYATGSLFALVAPDLNANKAPGEWNKTSIKYVEKIVTVTINGKQVLEALAENPDSETIPEKGYVALDGEAGGIAYRKILLSELP